LHSRSPVETRGIARQLARSIAEPLVVVSLSGPLGAGKTAFVKGLAEGLGLDPDAVTSPSFVIASEYTASGARLAHVDFHRLASEADLEATGFADLLRPPRVVAVEWGERFRDALPEDRLEVALAPGEHADEREMRAVARGAAVALLERWRASLEAPGWR
jgi:tRNA threonylcarbamoyladenosine biosynthesis protein TsaE